MRNLICLVTSTLLACSTSSATESPAATTAAGGEAPSQAEPTAPVVDVVGEEVTYESDGTPLKGYLAYDRNLSGKRPGVLIVHEWWGHNEYVRSRARMLAELGYTALAVDMYGEGKATEHPKEAKAFMEEALKDMDAAEARFSAGKALLEGHSTTDPERTAAIGYCFGGGVVLHMARAGSDLDAVVSFHGSLSTQQPAAPGSIVAPLLVMTGGDDTMVPEAQVAAFKTEMDQAGAEYEVVVFEGAKHAFTNPAATALGQETGVPIAYDEAADQESWERMKAFLSAVFSRPEPSAEEKEQLQSAARNRGDIARLEAEAKQEQARFDAKLTAESKKLAETKFASTPAALTRILASPHRTPGNAERDAARHPKQTLAFLGIEPTMTVFEYGPGDGWYTEILAPLLAAQGKLIVNNGDPEGPVTNRGTYYAKRFELFKEKSPELYGKVQVMLVGDPKSPELGMAETLDAALIIRGYHGMINNDASKAWLAEIHKALKPGGILGIVQHRAVAGADPSQTAKLGRVPEQALIDQVEAAGFKLAKKSEINANKKDEHDQPGGVWALPPSLAHGEQDRAKYEAIGESDRMTLKFVKVSK